MDVGDSLRLRRTQLKMTQVDLSRKTGIKQPTISAIENGVNKPNLETLVLLSDALGCSVSDLVGQSAPEPALAPDVVRLLSIYNQLNEAGKSSLFAVAESILLQPGFRKEGSVSSVVQNERSIV